MRMASAKERDELMRQINRGESSSSIAPERRDGSGIIQIISIVVIVAVLVFSLLYFLIVPAVSRAKERDARLDWLEEQIEERAGSDDAFQGIWEDYLENFPD